MSEQPPPHLDPKRKWILMAIPVCALLGVFEFQRALDGNHRSWVYVFEWPFFGVFILYMYWKLSQPREPFDDSDDPPRMVD
ncbi:MAG: hypothetical protein WCH42_05410 [Actinomycetes bacterium]